MGNQFKDAKTLFDDDGGKAKAVWLISYADMITLLLTFFLISLAIAGEIKKNVYREIDGLLISATKDLKAYVDKNNLNKVINVNRGTKGIHITISSGALFESGKADIKNDLKPALSEIGDAINGIGILNTKQDEPKYKGFFDIIKRMNKKVVLEARVEGHTDDRPIKTPEFPSNWELSYARSLNVVKFLAAEGRLSPGIFTAAGYSKYRPITPNTSEENRAKNRRVEIFIDANIEEINGNGK